MSRLCFIGSLWFGLCLGLLLICGCGDDDAGPIMVTVSGIVRSIDTGENAVGVRVRLLDTNFKDEVGTGTDGRYFLEVPKGSKLHLLTDDFDTSKADAWFPFINVDIPTREVNDNLEGWDIHSCPQTVAPACGSVALWDDYLQNVDDQANGDLFVPTSSASSSGLVTILFEGCNEGQEVYHEGMSVSTNTSAFPVSYWRAECLEDLCPRVEPSCAYSSSQTVTDVSGWFVSFGDPAFEGATVSLTFTDTNSERDLSFMPIDVPVRPGTISLVWAVSIDGDANQWFPVAARRCGIIPALGVHGASR